AGGFSSAVGEMGEETGAEVWLEKAPLKYSGLSYTEIWISEAQERMVLAVPESNWSEFETLCSSEGVEATAIGRFTDTNELVLKYEDNEVGRLKMDFLHDGRPPVIREATFDVTPPASPDSDLAERDYTGELKQILGSLNVASKEWIIRQYDHEVQSGSVVKPLVGVENDGPSDAAVVRPDLTSSQGLVISCGMNPHFGDLDPYWMAASAIDEAIRNCVAVGADPAKIAILDNFCWGNTERAETLGSLVRAALACKDISIAMGTPFVSGKDSLNNEFSYDDADDNRQTVAIPSTLLITALGQMADVEHAVTMDLKSPGNRLYLIGKTNDELGGSHFNLVTGTTTGSVPQVDTDLAARVFNAVHSVIGKRLIRSCHDLSEGGLAAAAAEMGFAGGVGVKLNGLNAVDLFSESNSRFLVDVTEDNAAAFESCFDGVPLAQLGVTVERQTLTATSANGTTLLSASLSSLKEAWQAPMGDM
ncbi:MAG TPA: phosphoribosylformylglycinamidine synthase, partial [Planctomycetaceae bacterium]|nr:phosphoribosylformylglycinamidine synthase [Planctomycetaceae bacterium]